MDSCRRRHLRLPIRVDSIMEIDPPVDVTVRCVARDISLGGTLVETTALETRHYVVLTREHPELLLRMRLPYLQDPLDLRARVRWGRRTPRENEAAKIEIGLQWVGLSLEQANRIQYVIQRLSAEETQAQPSERTPLTSQPKKES